MLDRMQFHRSVLDHLLEPVLATDATGQVQYMNPAAERLIGWPLWEAVNQPVSAILDPDQVLKPEFWQELLFGGECLLDQPVRVKARWGESLERRVSVSPLYHGSYRAGTVFVFHEARGSVTSTTP